MTEAVSARVDQALRQRRADLALQILAAAEAEAPDDVGLKMQRAIALRMSGDLPGALGALDGALALDPYNFMALLAKGAILERLAGGAAAAEVYRNALKIAPAQIPAPLQAPAARARQVVAEAADAAEARLNAALAPLFADCTAEQRARAEEAVRIFTGKQPAYRSEPLLLNYPRLPAIPFHDRRHFPWLGELEAQTAVIKAELDALAAGQSDLGAGVEPGFAPYMDLPPEAPVNQWAELNRSPRWSAYFLWRDGVLQERAARECPKTVPLLQTLPLARQPQFAPTVNFSSLAAGAAIPPHTGSTNARLLVHLPLIVPGPAWFRVGGETRVWREGEAWVFDDTIEHEARNEADATRVILILDVWNPYLDPVEREIVTRMLSARKSLLTS